MTTKAVDVVLYVPNLIDFARMALIILGLFLGLQDSADVLHLTLIAVIWTTSSVLDVFDGFFARKLNQTSWLGSILDMALDRTFDAVVCVLISLKIGVSMDLEYRQKAVLTGVYVILPFIDLFSHWCRTSQSYITGKKSHKFTEKHDNALLNFYYRSRPFMGILVGMYDAFLISSFFFFSDFGRFKKNFIVAGAVYICIPPTVIKTLIHVIQAKTAIMNMAAFDAAHNTNSIASDIKQEKKPDNKKSC